MSRLITQIGMTRAGGRAVDLRGGPSVYQGRGQSLKLSTKAAVFKRVSLLIGGGGGGSMSVGAGPKAQPENVR